MERGFFNRCYFGLTQLGIFLGHIILLIIRLYWGGALFLTGLGKFMHLPQVAEFFGTLGLPFPMFAAGLVAFLETAGGISLFLGLLSRLMSFLLIILFAVAYALAHTESVVNIVSNPAGFFMQDPFLYLYASVVVFCFGCGFASFDYWIERKRLGRSD